MADVRLTATTPDGEVVYVLANEKGELRLEEPIVFDGNLSGNLNVSGDSTFEGRTTQEGLMEVAEGITARVRSKYNTNSLYNFHSVIEGTDYSISDRMRPIRSTIESDTGAGNIQCFAAACNKNQTDPEARVYGFYSEISQGQAPRAYSFYSAGNALSFFQGETEHGGGVNVSGALADSDAIYLDVDGDVVIGSRGSKWLIRESNGVAMLIEQPSFRERESVEIEQKVRDLPNELDLIEAALNEVMTRLRMTPPAGWPVWDGSDINSER
jgi:hypothetical protein